MRGDPVPLHEQIRSQRRATLVGVLLALLGLCAAAVWALVVPRPDWRQQAVVVGAGSGAMYVVGRDPDRLLPVANLMAARLVLGALRALDPGQAVAVVVPDSALEAAPRGPAPAVAGAIDVGPGGVALPSRWAVCDEVGADGRVVGTAVIGGAAALPPSPPADGALLAGPDGVRWLVTAGRRHRIDGRPCWRPTGWSGWSRGTRPGRCSGCCPRGLLAHAGGAGTGWAGAGRVAGPDRGRAGRAAGGRPAAVLRGAGRWAAAGAGAGRRGAAGGVGGAGGSSGADRCGGRGAAGRGAAGRGLAGRCAAAAERRAGLDHVLDVGGRWAAGRRHVDRCRAAAGRALGWGWPRRMGRGRGWTRWPSGRVGRCGRPRGSGSPGWCGVAGVGDGDCSPSGRCCHRRRARGDRDGGGAGGRVAAAARGPRCSTSGAAARALGVPPPPG